MKTLRVAAVLGALVVCLSGMYLLVQRGTSLVAVREASSIDGLYRAQILAVHKTPLGGYEAILYVLYRGELITNLTVLRGRDEIQDIENEIVSINLDGHRVVIHTRGTFTTRDLEVHLPR
jgi:hypothetical protein